MRKNIPHWPVSRQVNLGGWPLGSYRGASSVVVAIVFFAVLAVSCGSSCWGQAEEKTKNTQPKEQSLFDGKSLEGWKVANFGGEGDVVVENGQIVMDAGVTLTGITYKGGELPTSNYEISLQAMRVDGVDFFCGLTFPVKDSHASFIVGGWGGAVVGISSIDGRDASDNQTTSYQDFKTGKWYKIRLRVTDKEIEAWIDDKQVVDQNIEGRKISTRIEVDLSKPLGISAWETKSALKDIVLTRIED